MGKRARRAREAAAVDAAADASSREHGDSEQQGESAFVWLFLGVLLLVPIVPWPFLHWNVSTFEIFPPAETLVFTTLTLTASLFAMRAMQRHFRQLTFQPLDLAVFLLYLYFALSALWSSSPAESRDAGMTGLSYLVFYV